MDLTLNWLKIQAKYHGTLSARALRFQNPCNGGTLELLHVFPISVAEFEECNVILSTSMKVPD